MSSHRLTSFILGSMMFSSSTISADTYTWNGLGSNNDLSTASNWLVAGSPAGTPPGPGDDTVFNSAVSNISLNPTSVAGFDVLSLQFPQNSNFSFILSGTSGGPDSSILELGGTESIIVASSKPTITSNNINNLVTPSNSPLAQVAFSNSVSNNSGSATYNLTNNGTYTGASPIDSSVILGSQFYAPNPISIDSGAKINLKNIGVANTSGAGTNNIGYINQRENSSFNFYGGSQLDLGKEPNGALYPVTIGNGVIVNISNSGTDSSSGGQNSTGYVQVSQVSLDTSSLAIGNNVTFNLSNIGVDTSTSGSNYVGLVSGPQMSMNADDGSPVLITVGNNFKANLSNSGTYSPIGVALSPRSVGTIDSEGFLVETPLEAGNNFSVSVANIGLDSSFGDGGGDIGIINSNAIIFEDALSVLNNARLSTSNKGTYTGSNSTSTSYLGYIGDEQITIEGALTAGDSLVIEASNVGIDHSSGIGGNYVGLIDSYQIYFDDTVEIGNNAKITASNDGVSSATTSSTNYVGYVHGSQIVFDESLSAGTNLQVIATNSANNTGTSDYVGYLDDQQIEFAESCSFGNGTLISATNQGDGYVGGSQIIFEQGFTLASGSATIQAINEGTISSGIGISVENGAGGNVKIALQNNQLNISSPEIEFTIGQLNGNSTSSVRSSPTLVINTLSGVNGSFAGDIQDYSGASTLTKSGVGTQTLSGVNTFTGLTKINEGNLILTGSLAGPATINPSGTLKGIGSIGGNVVNLGGTISPGQSIGTIHFLSAFDSTGGYYDVEVNGAGQSDLISVTGIATVDGGTVRVSTPDGTYSFNKPYTIVEAAEVIGQYGGVAVLSPMVTPELSKDDQHIYLSLSTNIINGARTKNQLAVARQLDSITDPTVFQNILLSELVGLSPAEAQASLDSLSGFQHTFDEFTTLMTDRQFVRRLYDPLRSIVTTLPDCYCCPGDFSVWAEAGWSYLRVDHNEYATNLNANSYNVTAGLQKTFCCDWTLGVAGSYDHATLNFSRNSGDENCSTWLVGLYGLYRPSMFYGLVDFVYGQSHASLNRHINVGDLAYNAHSNPHLSQFTFYGEVGFDLCWQAALIQPFFGIEAGAFNRNHIQEDQVEGFGLDVQSRNRSPVSTRLGLHVTSDVLSLWNVSVDLAWNSYLSSNRDIIAQDFETFGDPFDIRGIDIDDNSLDYAVTVSRFWNDFKFYVVGAGEVAGNYSRYDLVGGVSFNW